MPLNMTHHQGVAALVSLRRVPQNYRMRPLSLTTLPAGPATRAARGLARSIRVSGVLAVMLVTLTTGVVRAEDPPAAVRTIDFADPLPYGQKPIDYLSPESSDAAAALNRRLAAAEVALEYRKRNGYLRSLLSALDVPLDSQLLVFSKTALNPNLVTPKNPRSVYFNDDVYLGWVPGADSIEVMAVDPIKGMMFYTLAQDAAKPGRLIRQDRCLACHAGQTTLQVPGAIVRSFLTEETGKPTAGYSRITHETPFANRGGGWFVTGTHGDQTHCGNLFGRDAVDRLKADPHAAGNATDLKAWLDVTKYESPHSDLVAHLVLQHQAHGHNLLIRVNQESRLGRRSDAEDRLLRYLVFADEAPLTAPVRGTSSFEEWFGKRGPTDDKGRSLRTFDLKSRLFAHRLSYLIYSEAFDGLPAEVRTRLYERLWRVVQGTEPAEADGDEAEKKWPSYSPEERAAIVQIVRATKKNLPAVWTSDSD